MKEGGSGPEADARLLWQTVNTPNPRLRYTVGPAIQRAAVWLERLRPRAAIPEYYRLDRG